MYNAAMMQLGGKGTARQCRPALALLKEVAERGADAAVLRQAHEHFFKGHNTQALLLYLQVGEEGGGRGGGSEGWQAPTNSLQVVGAGGCLPPGCANATAA
jgi:SEL1 protein